MKRGTATPPRKFWRTLAQLRPGFRRRQQHNASRPMARMSQSRTKLAAFLVPTPRVNLTRYHGVYAPNHRLREPVTPARRGRRDAGPADEAAPARQVSMTPGSSPGRAMGATLEARVQDRHLDLRALWWCAEGDREHRRSSGGQPDPCASGAARRARDASLQSVRTRAAASGMTGPEGTRLTVFSSDLRRDARLV